MSELKEKAIKAAEKFLERRGYEVIESNWKSEGGNSLDLVAREDDTGYVDMPVRFDSIAMMLLSENRALLKHHINCLGCGLTAGQAD